MNFGITRKPADVWFSYIIRFRDNWTCQLCGVADIPRRDGDEQFSIPGPSNIECMHLVSRGGLYSKVRHDPRNAIAGCHKCHDHYSRNEEKWVKYCQERWGQQFELMRFFGRQINPTLKYTINGFSEAMKKEVVSVAKKTGRLWVIKSSLKVSERKKYGV